MESGDSGLLRTKKYTVVGIGSSPLYIAFNRGNTTLGSGEVNGFAYLLPEDFDQEVYTQIYLRLHGAEDLISYTDAYDHLVDKIKTRVEGIQDIQCQVRYDTVAGDAREELADARKELEDGKKEAQKELADAQKELKDGEKELEDGRKELEKTKADLKSKKKQTESGINEIKSAIEAMSADPNTPAETVAALEGQLQQLEAGKKQIDSGLKQIKSKEKTLASNEKQLQQGYDDYYSGQAEAEAGLQSPFLWLFCLPPESHTL